MKSIRRLNEEINKAREEKEKKRRLTNSLLLCTPEWMPKEVACEYRKIAKNFEESIAYEMTLTDVELVWQYCQQKILRDRAWEEWNKNPMRYTKIVTGSNTDGSPRQVIKENEHYRILVETNRQMEKILKDLRLTPRCRKAHENRNF